MDAANILVSVVFPDKELLIRWKKVVPLEQKYALYGTNDQSEKRVDMCAENIEEGNNVTSSPCLARGTEGH